MATPGTNRPNYMARYRCQLTQRNCPSKTLQVQLSKGPTHGQACYVKAQTHGLRELWPL